MTSINPRRRSLAGGRPIMPGLAIALLGVLSSIVPPVHASERVILAVFVAKSSSVRDLNLTELRRLFTNSDDSGFSGPHHIPFNHMAHSTDRVGFDRVVLRMNSEEVSRFWIDHKIRGLPGAPRSLSSLPLLVRLVARLPGAISYGRPSQITEGVRVIRVEGKLPTDTGYPLQFAE